MAKKTRADPTGKNSMRTQTLEENQEKSEEIGS